MKLLTKLGTQAQEKLATSRWRDAYRNSGDAALTSEIGARMPNAVAGYQHTTNRHLSPEMMSLRGNKGDYAMHNMSAGLADALMSFGGNKPIDAASGHRIDAGMHNPATMHNDYGGLGNTLLKRLQSEKQTGEHAGIPNVIQRAIGYTPSLEGNLVKSYKKLRG